jgi:hypothetical protein
MESPLSIVQVESEQWTVHSPHQTQLGKKKTLAPFTHKKRSVFHFFIFFNFNAFKTLTIFPFLRLLSQIYTREKNIHFFPKTFVAMLQKFAPKNND